ncbi:MAG TPA: DUF4058 family protein [Gemmataceae bacterium]|nr:DUF4058 family protein [Gemmataceae bacterium]
MPVHDWTRVKAGIFHDFHQEWILTIKHAINRILKGTEYYALAEQIAGSKIPDVLTLEAPTRQEDRTKGRSRSKPNGKNKVPGVALATRPPKADFRISNPPRWYGMTKKSVSIRHVSEDSIVAVLEIVFPGNKCSISALNVFIRKAQDLLESGIHLSYVDLFPPTKRDPEGLHPVIWGEDDAHIYHFNSEKPLTCASYIGGPFAEAFVQSVAVGHKLPDLSVFLTPDDYITVPLEATYDAAFEEVPGRWREVLER